MNTAAISSSRDNALAWPVTLLHILLAAAAMVIAAHIRVPLPWTPVPATLQTFVVLAMPFLVGPGRATAGIALYLVLGLLGAPFFAAASFATMGYLLAFLAAPFVISRFSSPAMGILAASLLIYALGAAWLKVISDLSWLRVLEAGVLPFLPGDALKAAAAYGAARAMGSAKL